jgi:trimeric autotransporter adhesin
MKTITSIIYPAIALACFALLPRAQALTPPPDGGYPGGNTAEGQSALLSLTTGTYNTAVGYFSLLSDSTTSFNTAIGAGALLANTGDENTATGVGALLSNTSGSVNTANGVFALFSNTTGNSDTANGGFALFSNTTGFSNTAVGQNALAVNTTGTGNTANGAGALASCTTGGDNTALGVNAGINDTTGNNNVYIGAGVEGFATDDGVCRIGSIYGSTVTSGIQVFVNADNRLGTVTSSKRFKEEIKRMDKASEGLLSLKPVTFRYKKEIDPEGKSQFGLVAEDVEKVNPDLVVHDKQGKPYSVRYDQINAMLLNEFLKEHRKNEEQQQQIEAITALVKEQASQIRKVTTAIEVRKSSEQIVFNNR